MLLDVKIKTCQKTKFACYNKFVSIFLFRIDINTANGTGKTTLAKALDNTFA